MAVIYDDDCYEEWYPLRRCIAWIDMHRPPIEWATEEAHPISSSPTNTYAESTNRLLRLAAEGKVELKGKVGSSETQGGQITPITMQQIAAGGLAAFSADLAQFRAQTPAGPMIYDSLQANIRQVMKWVPPFHFDSCNGGYAAIPRDRTGPTQHSRTSQLGGPNVPETPPLPPYLDEKHDRYSPKLAAAVMAWLGMKYAPGDKRRNTPKKAAKAWLTDNKAELGPNAIKEISTLVNWMTSGGAPKGSRSEKE